MVSEILSFHETAKVAIMPTLQISNEKIKIIFLFGSWNDFRIPGSKIGTGPFFFIILSEITL